MTDSQENKRSTYLAVFKILNAETHKPIWQDDADFAALITQFENYITDINTIRAIQEQDNTGIALLKADVRARLTNAIVKVINGVVAHAIYTDNVELQNKVNFSIGDLQTSRDSILADKAGIVYDTAGPIRAALVTRRITEADISLVDTLKNQFLQLIPEPREGIIENSTATEDLQNKFKQTDNLLNSKLDKTILIYRPEFPDFITKYFKARSIIDYGVRHTRITLGRITGTILQAGTQTPLINATVRVVGRNRQIKTDASGKFSFVFRVKGTYIIQVILEGYKLYNSQPITINPGDLTNLKIELEPNE